MHPSRRRKKRPNYGIRTVEVMRGTNGFGFTISGQQPCILSCIVSNSPADQAGLRAGDFLISVNGISVSKITHDAVVNLIGNCVGPIRMTIAENYYSDSSDEELDMARIMNTRKPKYMHKPRPYRIGKENIRRTVPGICYEGKNVNKARDLKNCLKEAKVIPNIFKEDVQDDVLLSSNQNSLPLDDEAGPIEYKALVGYLGTIEMPKQLLPNARLQTVCTCIRKLRQEKRAPTTVLMTILPTCLTLKNSSNNILAIYPTNRVVYIGSATDKESRYFGLVTSAVCDSRTNSSYHNQYGEPQLNVKKFNNAENEIEISNSCHVFATDPKMVDHSAHIKKAESFKVMCTPDTVSGTCLEFPCNALYIINLVQTMYKLQQSTKVPIHKPEEMNLDPILANSPQPSASSNSDSGIGFRDDCGNVSDRILVVEFPVRRVLPIINNSGNNNRPLGIDALNIPLEILNLPLNNASEQKSDPNNLSHKNLELSVPNNLSRSDDPDKIVDNAHLNNLNNIRACDATNMKNSLDKSVIVAKQDYLPKQHNDSEVTHNNKNNKNIEGYGRLTCRAMPDPQNSNRTESPSSITSSEDNNHVAGLDSKETYNERPVDVPDLDPIKKSCENSVGDDLEFKSSTDNVSMHSAKSIDINKCVFKTPSMCMLENKKAGKHQMNVASSCDNLDKCDENVMSYKLSPKVYGLSKPNYSCEELNNLDSVEKFGYGSLQDLSSWTSEKAKRNIAQSEPDVRIQRNGNTSNLMCEQNGQSKSNDTEGPSAWATSFEKLLEDPVGLHMFAEFLRKEYSAENIYFWTACERYRRLSSNADRREEAQRIYQRHLCMGALEPVNVDSRGRQCTDQQLQGAEPTLFDQAQKQIFNLMKFDSYPRFLKSTLYKECLAGIRDKPELEISLMIQPQNSTPSKLKKSLSNAEDRRRKSLLPWNKKNRSKSKDRGESEYIHKVNSHFHCEDEDGHIKKNKQSDIHSSRSSLTSLDLAVSQDSVRGSQDELSLVGRTALCRVILSNGSTTVVQIKESETIQQLVKRLLEKRGLIYSSFEVYTDKHHKALDVNESSTKLAGCEVTVEQRVVFKLDLPNRKVISVKSKYTKVIVDVLRPILHKYNYNLDQVTVTRNGDEPVILRQQVSTIDNARLNIQLSENVPKLMSNNNTTVIANNPKPNNNKLDEITNQVFEGILQEKSEIAHTKPRSDKGSVKSEDWGSEHSSGIFGKFLRRDSALHERKKKLLLPKCKGVSGNGSSEDANSEHSQTKKPLIAKWKAGVNKFQLASSESDELVEGLTRAQRSRLEDQRGTEINFELPDFLKDKEKDQNLQKSLSRHGDVETSKYFVNPSNVQSKGDPACAISSAKNIKLEIQNYENTNIVPMANNISQVQCQSPPNKLSNLRIYSPNKFPINSSTRSDHPNHLLLSKLENTSAVENNNESPRHCEPPPLPPKPKIVPIKPSNWGHSGYYRPREMNVNGRSKNTIFLEQPSSSFV